MLISIAAIIFTLLIGMVIILQLGLALGMPWGEYSMGGKFPGKYPPALRVVCLFEIILLAFLASIVLAKAKLALPGLYDFSQTAIWFVVGFSALSFILNSITPSRKERRLWQPVAVFLLLTSLFAALV